MRNNDLIEFLKFGKGLSTAFKFKIGHVVHYKRYDHYGVIFHADGSCKADDEWYNRNRTQPDRQQPWYNVLVDGGNETYVAEENLEFDRTGKKIEQSKSPLRILSWIYNHTRAFDPIWEWIYMIVSRSRHWIMFAK